MSGLREALEKAVVGAFDEMDALFPDGPPMEALIGQIVGYVLAAHPAEPAPVVNRERIAEVLDKHVSDAAAEAGCTLACGYSGDDLGSHMADALFAAGVVREPQPVDRDALIQAMARADRRPVKPESSSWKHVAEETYGRYADAMLALLNGSATRNDQTPGDPRPYVHDPIHDPRD